MADFNPQEFFIIGIDIANKYGNDCGYRTAIGRVYYACHLIGSDAAEKKGWFHPKHGAGDHSRLWRELRDKNKESIARKLQDLYAMREHADYHIEKSSHSGCRYCNSGIEKQTWERASAIANNILPQLEAIYPTQQK
jgi:hypothetical protein